MYTGDTGWWQCQVGAVTGTTDPFRARVGFEGQMMGQSALYLYEITFVKNPEGDFVNTEGTSNADGSMHGMDKPNGQKVVVL